MDKLDKKFYGDIRKVKDGTIVPEDQYVVFLAKDDAFAAMLPYYRETCVTMSADIEQIQAVDRLIQNVNNWRAMNQGKCKVPDAHGEILLD